MTIEPNDPKLIDKIQEKTHRNYQLHRAMHEETLGGHNLIDEIFVEPTMEDLIAKGEKTTDRLLQNIDFEANDDQAF